MAPKKSTGEDKGKSVAAAPPTRQTRSMGRKTRSQTQGSSSGSSSSKLFNFEDPEKRKSKSKAKEGGPAAKKVKKEEEPAEEEKEEEPAEEAEPEVEEEPEDEVDAAEKDDAAKEDDEEGSEKKKIVIEHCKQCKSFKERANEVKGGLENAVPGIIVTLNPDKPRRGCFEIREEGGETFLSLLEMKRPFKEMKDLDMEQVVAEIVEKLK